MHKAWFLVLLAVSAGAHAAPSDDDAAVCRNGMFTSSPSAFSLAKVVVPRLYLNDSDGCPHKGEAECRQRSYMVKGDVVVLAQRRNDYACAFYPNKVGGSAGWVAERSLQPVVSPAIPPTRAWDGNWHDGDNTLQLTANGDGSITVNGDAYWPSANPSPEQVPGGPHIGAVTARSMPDGNRLDINEDDCTVRLQVLGDLLIVADNLQCGGANVSFGGVYRRKR
ncbi:hypothetical protein [Xanthomonas vesicatoria]|uniref:SH3 domain-containing protein n=1 Tax=Xanthomonas vesicatoria TaxID=56460 RepID=A0AAJ0N3D9_9XANT|nr:hypothetical protein [Xanthomonas vesicatoria]APO95938.1 hypothetical protein BI313_16300 [Xanthomonas vesicatoria]KHM90206.1 hypothetical protein OR60_22565 [Xanthomonas vesicatoria]KHM91325.1 hypothetical protein OR61_19390 [Xanthomonas vesicatoria]MCC8623551.1 hypothetical protein [Xanthomonas vesicatoria]MCC8693648.1 hypothetical protein [Xanthomonas vesicatoria]